MQILSLDIAGMPREWLTIKEAVSYYTTGKVSWTLGEPVRTLYGGIQRKTGERSSVTTHSIIAVDTSAYKKERSGRVSLTNRTLFGRDKHTCAYCAKQFNHRNLSRDHIVPRARGGENKWMNVVTSCMGCNMSKGSRTPEEAGMELCYAPYIPNLYEHLLLQNRNILADQMEYLKTGLPRHSRVL